MMELIMNERIAAEKIIDTGKIEGKPGKTLSLLARYYCHIEGKKPAEIKKMLNKFMSLNYKNYYPDDWETLIKKCCAGSKKYPIVEIDEVPVTKNELTAIKQIGNKKAEKLAFVLLVVAKFCNMRNEKNNGWVMVDKYNVLPRARITGTVLARYSCFHALAERGLITYSKKVDSVNVRVEFIDNDSEIELLVTDFREFGYQYLMYRGENFIKCAECGVVTRATIHNKKYCKDCAGYRPVGMKKVICCDCGKGFTVDARNAKKIRCDNCQVEYRKKWDRERKHK